MRTVCIALGVAALGAAFFVFAADVNFPIYFPDGKLVVKADVMNRTVYLPLRDILGHMMLPYTDSVSLETLTIRSGNNRLVITRNSALISYNDQISLLPSPILREDNRWLVPVEFLNIGLSRVSGTEFRYRAGTSRAFAGSVDAPELEYNAQTLGPITRLTIRSATPIKLEVRRDDSMRAILAIDRSPVDPARERIDHRDRLLRGVAFDDSDGNAKIAMDITRDVADVRVTSADNNRIYFVDLLRQGEGVTAAAPFADPGSTTSRTDAPADRRVRVIVIDPGHGGTDTGATSSVTTEKDLMLTIARKLRTTLQMRLGATVLLTRDSDVQLDNEARSAVANNNQANLLLSLHAGYSQNKSDPGSSIFVMKEDFGNNFVESSASGDQLFLPWYLGYRIHRQASVAAANILHQELDKALPGWKFPVRTAPLAVLSSATMPAVLVEIGNLNNPTSAQALVDAAFQTRLANSLVDAVQRFSESSRAAAN